MDFESLDSMDESMGDDSSSPEIVDSVPPGAKSVIQDVLPEATQAAENMIQNVDVDTILSAIEQFKKSQAVRIVDFTILGPLFMFYAWRGRLSLFERGLLGIIGASTIIYNYRNWQKNRDAAPPITSVILDRVESQLQP